jgi:NADH-quinone oxidoreductase subunit H
MYVLYMYIIMPQLDKVGFIHIIFWFIISICFMYIFIYLFFIFSFTSLLKIRLKFFIVRTDFSHISPNKENLIITNSVGLLLIFPIIYQIFDFFIFNILIIFSTLVPLLITIAFYTLAERKIIAAVQRRRGPNVVGLLGLLQPIADGLKLLLKEVILPTRANKFLFLIAPILTLTISFVNISFVSFSWRDCIYSSHNLTLLIVFAISSFSIYGIIIAGWASNSRYPFLGALRSASQIISYEVSLTVIFLTVAILSHSFNLIDIITSQAKNHCWFVFPLFPLFIIFFISVLAETNRAPFDLPEAEAEIVAGYNLEYSSIIFAIFFLGEYCNIIFISSLSIILFFGGYTIPIIFYPEFLRIGPYFFLDGYLDIFFGAFFPQKQSFYLEVIFYHPYFYDFFFVVKVIVICSLFVFIRATFPRLRYDQLIRLGWKIFLPLTCGFYFYVLGWIFTLNANTNLMCEVNVIFNFAANNFF